MASPIREAATWIECGLWLLRLSISFPIGRAEYRNLVYGIREFDLVYVGSLHIQFKQSAKSILLLGPLG